MTRVVFMGTPEFAVPSLEALIAAGYEIVGVLTKPDQPAGRGQRLTEPPVKQVAQAHGLSVYQPDTLRSAEAQAVLAALVPDVIVVAAYGLILPPAVLALPRFGCVNVHGSLLPRHRGAAPVAAAILAGDAQSGATIMLMDAGVDTGPILASAAIPLAPDETTGSLTRKLAELGAGLLIVLMVGAQLNAELEHQTARDTTTGEYRPMGERGAVMADTLGEPMARSRDDEPRR